MTNKSKKLSQPVEDKVTVAPPKKKESGKLSKKSRDHKLLMKVARKINCDETKYLLLSNQSLNMTITGTPASLLLNPLLRGTTVQSRIGDKIKGLKLNIKGRMTYVQNAIANQTTNVRIIILKDTEANGAVPLFNAVSPAIGYLFSGANGAMQTHSMYNFNNTNISRFSVRYDKVHTLTYYSNTNANAGNCSKLINISISNLGCFNYVRGNAGDITDMEESLYMYVYCDTPNPTFVFDSAFYFTDN
jgi:hypothetical protein